MRVIISNLVYGEPYTTIFLRFHLKSLLENLNPSPFDDKSIYLIYTDGKNIDQIKEHVNYHRVKMFFNVLFVKFNNLLSYQERYINQTKQIRHSVQLALQSDAVLSHASADVYYGQGFWRNVTEKFRHKSTDAVFGHALRTTYETSAEQLSRETLDNDRLFDIGYDNMHPLWLFSNWHSSNFTQIPYHLIWTKPDQIICRAFSISSLLFRPSSEMLNAGGCSDITLKKLCKNFYFENIWQNAPCLELGTMSAFFPMFTRSTAQLDRVVQWALANVPSENFENLLMYQVIAKKGVVPDHGLVDESRRICESMIMKFQQLR
jgi:hypothetical protein